MKNCYFLYPTTKPNTYLHPIFKLLTLLFLWLLAVQQISAQGLVINEISQGSSGTKEYVELVVEGPTAPTTSCETCLDLRGWILDDNNGYFTGGDVSGGNGVSTGAIRFKNVDKWACLPFGTIIVVYNPGDVNAKVQQAIDNGLHNPSNCVYIIPANDATSFDGEVDVPSALNDVAFYPLPDGDFGEAPNWDLGSLGSGIWANNDNPSDSYQTIPPSTNGIPNSSFIPYHSISWGSTNIQNNGVGYNVYMGSPSSIGQYVWSLNNAPFFGFALGTASAKLNDTDETPGEINNPQNQQFFDNMFKTCGYSPLTLEDGFGNPDCENTGDGSITIEVTDGELPLSWQWTSPQNGSNNGSMIPVNNFNLPNLAAGDYSLTVTDAYGCSVNTMASVLPNPNNTSTSSTPVTNCGEDDGTVVVQPAPPNPYTYLWNNPATSTGIPANSTDDVITGLLPGGYTVTATDSDGCQNTNYAVVSTSIPNNECINVTAHITRINFPDLGDMNMSTEWVITLNGVTWIFDVNPNIYAGQFIDVNNFLETNTVAGTGCANPPFEVPLGFSNGLSSAQLDVFIFESDNITGDNQPHSCEYDDEGNPGTVDSGNLTGDDLIHDNTETLFFNNTVLPIFLDNYSGQLQIEYYLTCSPGTPPPPTVDNTTLEYCAGTDDNLIITSTASGEPGAFFTWYYDTDTADPNNLLTVVPVGTAGPGDETLMPGVFFTQDSTVYVTQTVNGCESEGTLVNVIVNQLPFINILPASLCDDGMGNVSPATITPIVAGGDGNYTYSWSVVPTSSYSGPTDVLEITTTGVGNYTLVVTDGNGCQATGSVVVDTKTPPEVDIVITSPTTCLGAVIEVTANVTDPDSDDNGTYFYNWAATGGASIIGEETATITATANTTVTVIVTDSNGCQGTDEILVTLNPIPAFPSELPEILVCIPDDLTTDLTQLDAAILVNVANGTVTWYEGDPESGGIMITNPTTFNASTAFMPIYAQITDNDTGCQNAMEIPKVTDFTPTADAGADDSVCNASDPILLTGNLPVGQTGVWSGTNITNTVNGEAEFDPTGLSGPITLTYTLTSQFGCPDSDEVVITVSPASTIDVSTTDVSGCGESNGTASVDTNPPGNVADVIWSNNLPFADISNLAPGGYAVTVTDNGGCVATDYALVSTNIPSECVEVTFDITRINFPPLEDGGGSNTEWVLNFGGAAWVFAVPPAGTADFVELNNLLENSAAGDCNATPIELSLGNYDITNVPAASIDLIVFESDNSGIMVPHSCNYDGTNAGPIDSGNMTGDDLLYDSATDGQISFDLTTNSSGVIDVFLSAIGETISIEYVLTCGTSTLDVDAGADMDVCENEGIITLEGSPPPGMGQTGEWSGPAGSFIDNGNGTATFDPSGSAGLTSILTYTFNNGNGCVESDAINITINSSIAATLSTSNASCTENNGTATASPTGANYSYAWSHNGNGLPQTTSNLTLLPAGLYTVTVTDNNNGCQTVASEIVSTDIADPSCANITAHFTRFSTPPIPPNPILGNDTILVISLTGVNSGSWLVDIPTLEGTNGLVSADELAIPSGDINTSTCDLPPYEIQIEDGIDCDGILPIDVSIIVKDETSVPLHSCSMESGDLGPFQESVSIDLNSFDNLISIDVSVFTVEIEYYLTCTPITPVAAAFAGLETAYCEGETIDPLPPADDNGLAGTWTPASIDNMTSGSYTFAPACDECADDFILNVTINEPTTPEFDFITKDEYCVGETPELLTSSSSNGVVGNWSSSPIDTDTPGQTTYTFTPAGGQCADPFFLNITVNPLPTVNAGTDDTVCEGAGLVQLTGSPTPTAGEAGTWTSTDATVTDTGNGTASFDPTGLSGDITLTYTFVDVNGCENNDDIIITVNPAPEMPVTACYETATFNMMTCMWEVEGEQPPPPTTLCYETATFNDITCVWDVTGEQPEEPPTACYETATFNDITCVWDITGEQDPEPPTACYETANFDDTTCAWIVSGEQDPEPPTACYETANFDDTTCAWIVSGEQDPEPPTACYETATFNDITCVWDITGEQDPEPPTACYETANFDDTTCAWIVTGEQDPEPPIACYETATFDDTTCAWIVTGEQDPEPPTACYETATFDDTTCAWIVTGEQDPEPPTACYETATFDDTTCAWIVSGEQDPEPPTACYETATFDDTTCAWIVSGEQDPEPPTACYETANFDDTTCAWIVSGEQDPEPPTACYETATFNDITCVWDITGEQDPEPPTACYETANFDDTTCAWIVTGEQDPEPPTACYETATFDDTTCAWIVTGEQDPEPPTACYETATFDDTTCAWIVSGEQDPEPPTACYETATFDDATCAWIVSGEQDPEPPTACYETATFDDATCAWIVSGEQDPEPPTACYETATFDDVTCAWIVTGEQDPEPPTACYETATFDDVTCAWIVTGEQDPEPPTACYETATFDDTTCAWIVSGEQDPEPPTACYETATFDDTTCAWIVSGEQDPEPPTACYETATFDDTTCAWIVSGEQDPEPTDLECYQTTAFNEVTCVWDIMGEQPPTDDGCEFTDDSFDDVTCMAVNTSNCPDGTLLDEINCECVTDVVLGCTDPCANNYDPTATQDDGSCILPEMPTDLECWQTTTFNDVTCVWDITGEQDPMPTDLECWETTTFNDVTCVWDITGEQEPMPTDLECWQTTTFNETTCVWDIEGEQPPIDDGCEFTDDSLDEVTCMAVNTSNCPDGTLLDEINCECVTDVVLGCTDPCANNYDPTATQDDGSCILPEMPTDLECWQTTTFNDVTCVWDITGEQDPMPTDLECWETTTFNDVTCVWDITGEQEPMPTDLECWQTTTFNETTCVWDIEGEQPPIDDGCEFTDDSLDEVTCMAVNTSNCPDGTLLDEINCECVTDVVLGCTDPCANNYDPTATQDDGSCILPEMPTDLECWETTTFNDVTCVWDITGEQDPMPTDLECWETATFNDVTCVWDIEGEQPPIDDGCEFTDDSFDDVTCMAVNTSNCPDGTLLDEINCECVTDVVLGCTDPCANNYDPTATQDDGSCILPEMPTDLECWQTTTFNDVTCVWDITGEQDPMPTDLECWETTTFNDVTCVWDITGEQEPMPTDLECWQTTTFNETTCVWDIEGEQPPIDDGCEFTDDSLDEVTCMAVNTSNCPDGTLLDEINCECVTDVVLGCTDPCANNYDPTATQDDGSCILPEMPTDLECWETATFNDVTCVWDITGEQDPMPTDLECWETATFNDVTCVWDIEGEQPPIDDGCEFTDDSFDDVTCMAVNTSNCPDGTLLDEINCECVTDVVLGCTDPCANNYDPTATQDDGSCILPEMPTDLECWQTTTFNDVTCVWDITGEQDPMPTDLECWETTTFNDVTCVWDITGEQEPMPTDLECWQTTTFNETTCVWDIEGEQPPIDDGCEFTDDSLDEVTCMAVNTSNCPDGTLLDEINCECVTDVVLGCTDPCANNYDPTATQDDGSCILPEMPTDLECWETATFNDVTCVWDITGEQDPMPTDLECWETATFNDVTCVWDIEGEQPPIDDGCEFTDDSFDDVTCMAVNTSNCPDGTLLDEINCECVTDVVLGCTDPCANNYDPTATQDDGSCILPEMPTDLECWQTTTFNDVTCVWDITGEQDPMPTDLECWETTTFNDVTCIWDITGEQEPMPTDLECWQTTTFNETTCVWDIEGEQPPIDDGCEFTDDSLDEVTCMAVNTSNCPDGTLLDEINCECVTDVVLGCTDPCANNYDPTATQDDGSCILPEMPTDLECWETTTFNDVTCVWDITGEQDPMPTDLECWETATFNDVTCVWDIEGEQPPIDDGCEFTDDSFDDVTCMAVNTSNCPDGTLLDEINCECVTDVVLGCTDPCANNYDPTATQDDGSCILPEMPTDLECWQTTTFNDVTCVWDITGEQDPMPTDLECWETTTFNDVTCVWDITGEQEPMPTDLECWQTTTFNETTCVWDIEGEQPPIDDGCEFTDDSLDEVTCMAVNTSNCPDGTLLDEINCECVTDVVLGCTDPCANNYDPTATQDDGSCILPEMPTDLECWETTTFNDVTCVWDITGEQEPMPTDLECWQTTTFNETTCVWDIEGEQPPIDDGCEFTDDSFDDVTCMAVNTSNCPTGTFLDEVNCECITDVILGCTDPCANNYDPTATQDDGSCILPEMPTDLECWETTTFNDVTCVWDITGEQDPMPTDLECWQTTTFNDVTCVWDITGEQDPMPTDLECWQTTTFNDVTCVWDIEGEQPPIDDGCEFTDDSFDDVTCMAVNTSNCPTGTFLDEVNCECITDVILGCTDPCANNYDPTATQDDGSCILPEMPTDLECWETTTFNDVTCVWDITGEQDPMPTDLECWQTTTFNDVTCVWDITGEQDPMPTDLECWQTTTFNETTCVWDIEGEQPPIDDGCEFTDDSLDEVTCMAVNTSNCPDGTLLDEINCECVTDVVLGCTDPCANNYDPTATQDDGSCILPEMPTDLECWETTTFNDVTCVWDITGEQDPMPTDLECWQTTTFNDVTCVWDITGEQDPMPTDLECWQTTTFNDVTCVWDIEGEQPPIDDGCEFTDDSFDDVTCMAVNTSNCPTGTFLDEVNCECITDVILGCTDPCANNYDPTATQDDGSCILPEMPTDLECWETTTFNDVTCVWDITGEQDPMPTDLECWQTTTFNETTCVWDIEGEQPPIDDGCEFTDDSLDEVTCMAVNTSNCPDGTLLDEINCECVTDVVLGCTDPCANNYDPTATQDDGSCILPEMPTDLECWQTTTFNDVTCVWDITGEQDPMPTDLECWQTTTFNDVTCVWDIEGEQPPIDDGCEFTDDSFDDVTCMAVNTSNCPTGTFLDEVNCECITDVILGCTDPCANNYDPTATQDDGSCILPEMPTDLECWETTTFNDVTCVWDITGEQDPMPTDLECWQTTTFNDVTCVWDITGEQDPMPTDLECWQTTTFNDVTCVWDIEGEQPPIDDGCEFTDDSFDDVTCMAVNTSNCPDGTLLDEINCECVTDVVLGCTDPCANNYDPTATQDDGSCILPEMPTDLECWETTIFNDVTCVWDITGEQDPMPTDLECWETATFNDVTCVWDIEGEQPPIDDGCEFTDDSFDDVTCMAVNTSNCPTGTFLDEVNCECITDVILGCTDPCANNYDPTATQDDGSCILPEMPTDLECWETTTFNDVTCVWDITGEQDPMPTDLECWQTTTFNDVTCVWDITGEQDPMPTDLECWQTTTFNDVTCVWDIEGEQPPIDDGCEFTDDSFDDVTCMAVNTSNCPDGTLLDEINCECVTDVVLGCTDPCANNYDPTATQDDGSCILPEMPTDLECWQTTTFNDVTCVWDVTGEQEPMPTDLECDETATFNDATCMWEIQSGGSFTIDIIDLIPPLCSGDNDGSISISTLGGTPPLMYSINGADFQSSNTFEGLTAGTYELLVNDANGCSLDSMVQLLDPDALEISLTGGGASCIGGDGEATVTASGGTGDYTYQWDDANTQTSGTAGGLDPGLYNVTVEDANGCTATGGVTIDTNSDVVINNIESTPNTCDSADGTLAITGDGGNPPYMYSIDDGATFQADSLFEGLVGGTYTIVVQDVDGCEASSMASIITNEDYSFPLADTLYILNGNPLTVVLPEGANYTWSPTFDIECNDNCSIVEISVTEETIFTVTATTLDGCEATQTITVIPIEGVIVPDIISPNGDGDNETFILPGVDDFPRNELSVYNRWGERVYHAQPYSNTDPWNGFVNGRIVPHGAYYYILELNVTEIPTLKGRVFIID